MTSWNLRQTSSALIISLIGVAVTVHGQQPTQPKPGAKTAALPVARRSAARPATPPPLKTPPAPGEKVVLKVGDEQVSEADLEFVISKLTPEIKQAVARQGKEAIGAQYALMLVLAGMAITHKLDSSPDFRRQAELQRLQMLAQAEYENIVNQTKVSPEEVSQYYAGHPEESEQAQVRQVIIRKKPDGAKEGTPGLSPQEAKTKAEEIRKAFAAGGDPAKVAEELSVPNVVQIDLQPRAIRRGQLPAELDKAAFELKQGEVSSPFETPQALILVQVAGQRHLELKDVSTELENRLRDQKVQASIAELRNKVNVWMDEQYFAAPPPSTPSPSAPQAPVTNSAPQR